MVAIVHSLVFGAAWNCLDIEIVSLNFNLYFSLRVVVLFGIQLFFFDACSEDCPHDCFCTVRCVMRCVFGCDFDTSVFAFI